MISGLISKFYNFQKINNNQFLMGIGVQAIGLYDVLLKKKQFKDCRSVLEMGSQDIYEPDQKLAKQLIKKICNVHHDGVLKAKSFYKAIGFEEYACVDADGNNDSLLFDLNLIIKDEYNFNKKFDLVTNFGTSEHLINQKNFFENVHNLTNQNGYILHMLPFEGYINHGYFNYQPAFFYDMATANNYEIVGFWYYSERFSLNFFHYKGRHYIPLNYDNKLIDFLDDLVRKGKFFMTPKGNQSSLAILYKKLNSDKFRLPFDNQFLIQSNLKGYSKNTTEKNISNKFSIDHKKQIEEILGDSYWKNKLKKFLFTKEYRKFFFRKVFFEKGYKKLLISRIVRFFKLFIK